MKMRMRKEKYLIKASTWVDGESGSRFTNSFSGVVPNVDGYDEENSYKLICSVNITNKRWARERSRKIKLLSLCARLSVMVIALPIFPPNCSWTNFAKGKERKGAGKLHFNPSQGYYQERLSLVPFVDRLYLKKIWESLNVFLVLKLSNNENENFVTFSLSHFLFHLLVYGNTLFPINPSLLFPLAPPPTWSEAQKDFLSSKVGFAI